MKCISDNGVFKFRIHNYDCWIPIVDYSQIFEFNLSSLTSTYWVEKTIDGVTTVVDKSEYSSNNSVSHVLFLFFSVNLEHSLRFSLKPASIQTNRLKV